MKSKEKGTIIIISIIIIWTSILIIRYFSSNQAITLATNVEEKIQISSAKKTDLDTIIKENNNVSNKQEISKEITELEYITKYTNNNEMLKGTTRVAQEGRNGTQEIIKRKTFDEHGNLTRYLMYNGPYVIFWDFEWEQS